MKNLQPFGLSPSMETEQKDVDSIGKPLPPIENGILTGDEGRSQVLPCPNDYGCNGYGLSPSNKYPCSLRILFNPQTYISPRWESRRHGEIG